MTTIARARLPLACLLAAAAVSWQADGRTGPEQVRKTPPDFASRAAEYMDARVQVGEFSGVVLVARGGRPVFRQANGMANREFSIPNTPTTKQRAGSAGKQFTAAAVLLLEQRGKN